MVQSLIDEAQIRVAEVDAIAVGQGPGSFTGLRIGAGVGQGLAYGANCPMIGVSSLDALALQAPNDGRVLAAIDARMDEVYWAEYLKQGASVERRGRVKVSAPEALMVQGVDMLVGNAWQQYWLRFNTSIQYGPKHLAEVVYPQAASLAELGTSLFLAGECVPAANFAPVYVRDNVAKKSVKQVGTNR
jgi:tRNA threonylcarbamoyladenosine biosynthesis protein TsaB